MTATEDQTHIRNILQDTGYCCRELLGWNYDEEEPPPGYEGIAPGKRVDIGTGGIRDNGPHKEFTDFIDDLKHRYKLSLMPRESYKSTGAQGYIVRNILANQDIKILYGMKDKDKLEDKLGGIRNQLERPEIEELFGVQKPLSGSGKPWASTRYTVAGRVERFMEPTVSGFTLRSTKVGGHYHIIVLDDLVDWDNVNTAEGIALVMRAFKMVQPLLLPGGILWVIGTPYAEGDLYWTIETKLGDLFKTFKVNAGFDVETQPDGRMALIGEPTFPHLTKDRLLKKLRGMQYRDFCSQYLLKIVSGITQPFHRTDFVSVKWDEDRFRDFTGYLLTDSATTDNQDNSFSVLGYVLFSPANMPYIADIRMGHMTPNQFVEEFFKVYLKWHDKCYHYGEVLERNAANNVYRVNLDRRAEQLGLRLNIMEITRGGRNDKSKDEWIERLQPLFANGEVFFLNTIPRTFIDVTEERVLFDPVGYRDPDGGRLLPDGELVTQFIRWPTYPFKDGPDMLADVEEIDKDGVRLLKYIHPRSRRRYRTPRRGECVLDRLTRAYKDPDDPGIVPIDHAVATGFNAAETDNDYFSKRYTRLFGS